MNWTEILTKCGVKKSTAEKVGILAIVWQYTVVS
jgi:hypothetical protein